jgi:hypothetical protein
LGVEIVAILKKSGRIDWKKYTVDLATEKEIDELIERVIREEASEE